MKDCILELQEYHSNSVSRVDQHADVLFITAAGRERAKASLIKRLDGQEIGADLHLV